MSSLPLRRSFVFLLALLGLLLLAWAVLTVVGTEPFDNEGYRVALISAMALTLALLVAGLVRALRGGSAARGQVEDARRAKEEAAQRAEEEHERAERQEREAASRAEEADQHRQAAERARRALERERQWSRELRDQVSKMSDSRSALSPRDDLRSLVLRVAMNLTEAPRGVLLGRAPGTDDALDVVAAEGFDDEERQSEIVQSFAARAMEHDVVIREDAPPPADDDITSLIAIPMFMADELTGVVICTDRPGGFDECDDEVLLALGDNARSTLANTELHSRLREAFVATVRLLTEAIQAKDPFLRGHSEDVAEYVEAISHQLEMDDADREQLAFASLLHDVGKIGISERILLKPGRLTGEERSIIELHPRIGYRMVEQVPGMQDIAPLVLHHHERWDGEGYPARLAGEQIPLGARVIGVADAFSAMTEQRPYRDRMSLEEACGELERCAGAQFDPRVVALFCAEARERPRERRPGPVATALDDGELLLRRNSDEGVLGVGVATLTDSLTLLYSHRYFFEAVSSQAERAVVQGSGFGVVIVRVTGVTAINVADGYARGDGTLRACARVLSQIAVRHGATACRIGGNRMALLVAGLSEAATAALGDEVRTALLAVVDVEVGTAAWRPGRTGAQVVETAEQGLVASVVADPPTPGAPEGGSLGDTTSAPLAGGSTATPDLGGLGAEGSDPAPG